MMLGEDKYELSKDESQISAAEGAWVLIIGAPPLPTVLVK
jgi:hypothetical protein